jgi:hypothetical protein
MSDGVSTKFQYGLTICTDGYTLKDVVRLINILQIRYDLDCTIHYSRGLQISRIYIKANSMNKLRKIVNPHIISF